MAHEMIPIQPENNVDNCLPNIRELTRNQLSNLMSSLGQPPYRAKQLHRWLYSQRVSDFEGMTSFQSLLRQKLSENWSVKQASLAYVESETSTEPDLFPTTKFLIKLPDGELVESVLIPSENRLTACISSQAGCALQCSFCATGQMGFRRDLFASEIIDQVFLMNQKALSHYGRGITNIVFMGMGEPLLNLDNVIESIGTLTEQEYVFSIPEKKITISTVGLIPQMERISNSGLKTRLAISLHSADQSVRERLMPVTAHYPLDRLTAAISQYNAKTGLPVTLVCMLLTGINDSAEDARKLARFAKRVLCKINLIDYNPIINLKFKTGCSDAKTMFIQRLLDAGLHVTVRKSQGTTINAACGQLATLSGNDGSRPQ
jgi:23S rRNA (adenine2503-C2)-methyltransferase